MKYTPKRYSKEEIQRRRDRLAAVRHLGPLAMIRKAAERKRRRIEQKALVKSAAAAGIFVPVQDFE